MRLPSRITKKTAFGAAAAIAALGAGGTAYAATSSTSASTAASPAATSSPATPASPTAGTKGRHDHSLLAHSDHGVVEVRQKGQWVTVQYDRGRVSSVSPTSITLARPDGQSVTEAITASTKFTGVSGESAITTGKPALVLSQNGSALRIAQRSGSASGGSTGSAAAPSAG